MGTYITVADVTKRMTSEVLDDIFGDDTTDATIEDFIADAESEVEQTLRKTYGVADLTWLRTEGTSAPRAVKRICLDIFEVRAMRRHPEYIRGGWDRRYELAREDLRNLQLRTVQLDVVADPEPGVTDGAEVESADPDATSAPTRYFDDMGIY